MMAAEATSPDAPEPLLLHGDCLELIAVAHAERGPFDLIYVDPPFAAGGARGARSGAGERSEGEVAYTDAWGGVSPFLDMLAPRLEAMTRALSERGSLWVHLDHRAVHDVKVRLDEILGARAFRGEIIWVPGNGGRGRKGLTVTHQTILVYAPSDDFTFDVNHPSQREPYAETSLDMHFRNVDEEGRRYRERTIGKKTYRYYADEGRRRGSVWADLPSMRANTPLQREATGYPTQKPEGLLERILLATTVPGSRVLDPMCGSGTTVAVASRLGRLAVGIDRSPVAIAKASARLGIAARCG